MVSQPGVEPSAWVVRWKSLIRAGGRVLDLACGQGRHALYLATLGHTVLACDRDADALATFTGIAGIEPVNTDLESGTEWPFAGELFDGVVVINYLYRPSFARIAASLAPGGVLIYETFALGNERYGKPSNPGFLLRPGELLEVFGQDLVVAAFEQGRVRRPKTALVQRLCAVRAEDIENNLDSPLCA